MRLPVQARCRLRGNASTGAKARTVSKPIAIAVVALALAACGKTSGSGAGAQPAPSPTLPVTIENYPPYGAAADFSWVAGRLVRSWFVAHGAAGECTYVVFSTARGGPWGGRVAIFGDAATTDRFPDGDMVVVTAQTNARAPVTCGEPAVSVATIAEH